MRNTIKHLYPGIRDDEFALQDDGEGSYIVKWARPEPKPTAEQITAAMPAAHFAHGKAAELADFRAKREAYLNRVAGIAFAAKEAGDTEVVAAAVTIRQGLLDATTHQSVLDALAAQDITALKLALRTRYAQLVADMPAAAKAAFKKVDQ